MKNKESIKKVEKVEPLKVKLSFLSTSTYKKTVQLITACNNCGFTFRHKSPSEFEVISL